jgi:hypothetical protein
LAREAVRPRSPALTDLREQASPTRGEKRRQDAGPHDARAVASALSSLLETAIGRLGTQNPGADEERIAFVRKLVFACDCGQECSNCRTLPENRDAILDNDDRGE